MISVSNKRKLDSLVAEPSFSLRTAGDSIYSNATGHRAKRLAIRGQLTPAGSYLQDEKGVSFPRIQIDNTQRTFFRGNTEYAMTQDGRQVKLRNAQGDLTARGKQVYTQAEITVEVPAIQVGTGKLGKFELETTRVYTEAEYPEIGDMFRRHDDGTNTAANRGFIAVKSMMLDMIKKNNNILAQESDMVWYYDPDREWVFACGEK